VINIITPAGIAVEYRPVIARTDGLLPNSFLRSIRALIRLTRPTELGLARQHCPLCGGSLLLRLQDSEHGIRCLNCRGGVTQMSLARAVTSRLPGLPKIAVYELSARGAFVNFLRRQCSRLTVSEYYDGVPPGEYHNGVQCQDVEKLTYADATFDLCTSSDVFEHVIDDRAGFSEVCRVLKPGGYYIFTVPLSGRDKTLERAVYRHGRLVHLQPPEYHDDYLRGIGRVLCFRTYGRDILTRLRDCGFGEACFDDGASGAFMGYGRTVVVARKAQAESSIPPEA
jgi:hypothetical protein